MSFTPGPWKLRSEKPQLVETAPKSKMFVLESADENEFNIGFACSWIDNPEDANEALSNARLLSCAPELLEALETLMAALDPHDYPDEQNAARAVIAKARGEGV